MHEDDSGDEGREFVVLRYVTESPYPGRAPVIVRTTRLPEPFDREARVRAGLRRLAREGRATSLVD